VKVTSAVSSLLSAALSMLTAILGVWVSTVKVNGALVPPELVLALRLCGPSPKALGVKLQLPCASAVAEPMICSPSRMTTTSPAGALPLKVGVASLVWPPLVMGSTALFGLPTLSLTLVMDVAVVSVEVEVA
jgi:hypothetical protein